VSARPVLALLHSSASSSRQWDALAQSLPEVFDVHAIDLHGHGARAPWTGSAPLSLADEAAPIETLIERRGAVHLVGHSYGGAVAIDVARRFPHAVQSVAVYEPVLFGCLLADRASRPEVQGVLALAGVIQDLVGVWRDADAAERFVDFWSGPGSWARLGPQRRGAIAARMPSVAPHFDAACFAPDPRPTLTRTPLLALTGADTVPAARRIGELMRAAWPEAEHRTLHGLGHMGPIADPAVVNACITDFLLRQVTSAPQNAALSFQPATA
jgi:pimeloyl-ACP methyl ester carboxylesterase